MNSQSLVLDLKTFCPFIHMLCCSQQVLRFTVLSDPALFHFPFSMEEKPARLLSCFCAFLYRMTHRVKKAAWNLGGYYLSEHRKTTFFFFKWPYSKSSPQQNRRWPCGDSSTVTKLRGERSGIDFFVFVSPSTCKEFRKVHFVLVLWNQHAVAMWEKGFSEAELRA